jgi:hypothetical protein
MHRPCRWSLPTRRRSGKKTRKKASKKKRMRHTVRFTQLLVAPQPRHHLTGCSQTSSPSLGCSQNSSPSLGCSQNSSPSLPAPALNSRATGAALTLTPLPSNNVVHHSAACLARGPLRHPRYLWLLRRRGLKHIQRAHVQGAPDLLDVLLHSDVGCRGREKLLVDVVAVDLFPRRGGLHLLLMVILMMATRPGRRRAGLAREGREGALPRHGVVNRLVRPAEPPARGRGGVSN